MTVFLAYPDTTDEITGLAEYSGRITVAEAIATEAPTYTVELAEAQVDSVTGKERWVQSDAVMHTHNPLALPADNTSEMNDPDPIYVTWTTQSLTLGVYREADDVEGFTDRRSALPGGDVRPHPEVGAGMTVELMTRTAATGSGCTRRGITTVMTMRTVRRKCPPRRWTPGATSARA